MKILSNINSFLAWIAEKLVSLFLLINVSVVFIGVIFRYVLNQPLGWVYELTIYLMMWSAFVGSSVVTRKKEHIAVDFLKNRLPVKYKKIVMILVNILVLIFLYIIIKNGITMIELTRGSRTPSLELPVVWIYSAIPVGFSLIFLQTLEIFLKDVFDTYQLFTNNGEKGGSL